jgi:hypothetical protein
MATFPFRKKLVYNTCRPSETSPGASTAEEFHSEDLIDKKWSVVKVTETIAAATDGSAVIDLVEEILLKNVEEVFGLKTQERKIVVAVPDGFFIVDTLVSLLYKILRI